MQDKLHTSISALRQLSPESQELVVALIRQLAERENIAVPLTPSTGLQTPADGMELWEAHLTAQNWSRNTIKTYKTLLTTYLRDDPTPTTLSIKQNLAKKMQTMSPDGAKRGGVGLCLLFSGSFLNKHYTAMTLRADIGLLI